MITVNYDFLKNELDFEVGTQVDEKVYKDYYYKICLYIYKNNAFRPTTSDIDNWITNGVFTKAQYHVCGETNGDERSYLFKRAIGLQLIYDRNCGRNTIAIDTDGKFDICRETTECLNMIGLIQPVRY